MNDDKRHVQMRLSPELRQELENLSKKYGMSISDIVRGALFFGLPVFDTLTEMRQELAARFVAALKNDARIDGRSEMQERI